MLCLRQCRIPFSTFSSTSSNELGGPVGGLKSQPQFSMILTCYLVWGMTLLALKLMGPWVSLEVFEDSKSDLAIVQQRSPVVKGKMVDHAKHVADWADSFGFKEVFILSGINLAKRPRREIDGPQIHYISTSNPDGSSFVCDQLGWMRLEQADQLFQHQAALSEDSSSSQVMLTDDNYYVGLPFPSLLFLKGKGLEGGVHPAVLFQRR